MYFGGVSDYFYPDAIKSEINSANAPALRALRERLQVEQVVFLHQIHSSDGINISSKEYVEQLGTFEKTGDFLVTNVPQVGLGVLTADCLPIVMYDEQTPAFTVVHAGWRGSVAGISIKALEMMQQHYGSRMAAVRIFFGPSAQSCCYEISEDFISNVAPFSYACRSVEQRGKKLFFNLPFFNQMLLLHEGIKPEQIHHTYNICTMCNASFYSHRRQGNMAGRNVTLALLK